MKIRTQELVEQTGVKFGTSGLRDLISKLTDKIVYVYTTAFLQFLEEEGYAFEKVALAGDLRISTDRILLPVAKAITDKGYKIIYCGKIPTSAVTFYAIQNKIPSLMVTGSHIPTDRNGLKFQKPDGEILKDDEVALTQQVIEINESLFGQDEMFVDTVKVSLPHVEKEAETLFKKRFTDFFPEKFLEGKRIGLYGHSAVGRDILYDLLTTFGADVTKLNFCKPGEFVPIDTDAFREEDLKLIKEWSVEKHYDSVVTTDGDSDRPMLSTENGDIIYGDTAVVVAAHFLGAEAVATPISSNTQVDKSGYFKKVSKTKIGSPQVIKAVMDLVDEGYKNVIGYELNGGFITLQDIEYKGKLLKALPTRDAITLILMMLFISFTSGKPLSQLFDDLPSRFSVNQKALEFPTEKSQEILARINTDDEKVNIERIEHEFEKISGRVKAIQRLDGVRITFENDQIIHLRPSSNAPEFRAYTEATTKERARQLNDICMKLYEEWRQKPVKKIFQ